MAYGMLANSVEATKDASVQFAADARCVDVCLRGLEAGDEAIRVAAAKCVKAAAKRAPAFRGALARKGGILPLVAMAETGSVEAAMRAAWALANLAVDSAANKTAIREGRGLAALVNLLRRQRAGEALRAYRQAVNDAALNQRKKSMLNHYDQTSVLERVNRARITLGIV